MSGTIPNVDWSMFDSYSDSECEEYPDSRPSETESRELTQVPPDEKQHAGSFESTGSHARAFTQKFGLDHRSIQHADLFRPQIYSGL